MKKLFTLLAFLGLTTNFSFAQNAKAEAKDFGLNVIQSFFDRNCDFMFDHLAPTITSFEGGHQIAITPEQRRLFCSESPLRPDIQVSYQMYQENYNPVVYDHTELAQKFPQWQAHLHMQNGDFFFDGSNPVAAGNTRLFRAGDMARFVLRKVNGDWVIIAI